MTTATCTPNTLCHSRRRAGVFSFKPLLVLPLALLIAFSAIELCRYLWCCNVVSQAAATGARMASQHRFSDAEVAAAVERALWGRGMDTDHSVTIGARQPAQPVSVRVEAEVELVVLDNLIGEAAGLRRVASTSVMNHRP